MKKILTISDSPLSSSGVARQTRIAIEAFLESGNYEVVSIAVAQSHKNYTPYMTEKYGKSWKIFPTKKFSDLELVRSLIKSENPDLLWLMTDPRYFDTIWNIDTEIREAMPIIY